LTVISLAAIPRAGTTQFWRNIARATSARRRRKQLGKRIRSKENAAAEAAALYTTTSELRS
jgi:hypothetical protein